MSARVVPLELGAARQAATIREMARHRLALANAHRVAGDLARWRLYRADVRAHLRHARRLERHGDVVSENNRRFAAALDELLEKCGRPRRRA